MNIIKSCLLFAGGVIVGGAITIHMVLQSEDMRKSMMNTASRKVWTVIFGEEEK